MIWCYIQAIFYVLCFFAVLVIVAVGLINTIESTSNYPTLSWNKREFREGHPTVHRLILLVGIACWLVPLCFGLCTTVTEIAMEICNGN